MKPRLVRSSPISSKMANAPADDTGRRLVPPSRMRNAIARRMTQSKNEAPHFYVSSEIDMETARRFIKKLKQSTEQRVTLTALMIKAVALTLEEVPEFNAHWTKEGHELIDAVNIGVAIDLPDGLIAPAILGCESLGLPDISARLAELAERAKSGKLRGPEINDATFTLSNLGMFDVSAFTAIITPPQVAILATGRAVPLAKLVDDEFVARLTMTATLSSDHRAVDGSSAARFVGAFKQRLERPDVWAA